MAAYFIALACLLAVAHQAQSGYIGGYGGEISSYGGGESSGGYGGGSEGGHGHAYSTVSLHQHAQSGGHHEEEHYPHHFPEYKYDYAVKDHHTGDHKNAWEHRHGDKVTGGYMLKEADGTIRVVEYESDKHNGFNAVVKKIGHAEHPQIYGKYVGGHSEESSSQGGHYY